MVLTIGKLHIVRGMNRTLAKQNWLPDGRHGEFRTSQGDV